MFWDVFYKDYLIYLNEAAVHNHDSAYLEYMLLACRYIIDDCQLRCMEIISGKKKDGYCWLDYDYQPKN